MARLKVGDGCENYIEKLNKLLLNTEDVLGHAIYEGAAVVIKAVDSAIDTIPTAKPSGRGTAVSGLTAAQKAGLHSGIGIAKMRNDSGYVNVKIGFDGYNGASTKKYPLGQPNAMMARVAESGSTYHTKTPFIGPAVRRTKAAAEAAMKRELDKQIESKMI